MALRLMLAICILVFVTSNILSQEVDDSSNIRPPKAVVESLEVDESENDGEAVQQETVVEEAAIEEAVIEEEMEVLEMEEEDATRPKEGNVTLDFRDADIRNVLRIIAYKSGVNIVPSPDVAGLVTIQLTDVPWEQALSVILENYGYSYEKKGNIIMVTTIENLKKRREDALVLAEQEPLVTESFILNFAKASVVIQSVDKLKTSRGSVHYDDRTNTIMVRDTASNMKLISKIVEQLDATTPQVLIEAKILETSLSNTEDLGVEWTSQATISGSTRPHIWPFKSSSSNDYLPDAIPATTSAFNYGTLDFSELKMVLKFLMSKTDTNILSNPRIVTLDNQTASISVGVEYPYANKFFNKDTGTWEFSSWTKEDIGIKFDVTPHVNNANFITLEIKPEITDILELVTDTSSGSQAPKLSKEVISTNVMIRDGETLVIGGLIKDKVVETKKKVPFLGDIPFLGLAFQSTAKEVTKTDLLIFITPHIITPAINSDS